jgi:hypothetical protein
MTDPKYNDGLAQYIRDFRNQAENLVIDLAEIAYVDKQIRQLPEENTKIYFKSATVEETRDLIKGRSIVYPLRPEEINNFYLEVLSGKAESYVSYLVDSETIEELNQDNRLLIERTFKKVKGEGNEIKAGDIVQVTIYFNLKEQSAPPGQYIITDYLPSGLKYIENPQMFGLRRKGWLSHENQVVTYYFYNSEWWRSNGEKYLTYFARAGSVGNYIAEPAIIQSQQELSIFNSTPAEEIQILPSN